MTGVSPSKGPSLYLVVLGGRTPQTHVELHDVRWVAGCCIDDTIPELKRLWFGSKRGLHIDSYVRIDNLIEGGLHEAIDGLQQDLNRLHNLIQSRYFTSTELHPTPTEVLCAPESFTA